MTTQEIANELVKLCREGNFQKIFEELYSTDVKSIEPEGAPWGTAQGMEALQQKGKQWEEMVEEVHSSEVSDPIVGDDYFACTMKTVVTFKGAPEKTTLNEICLYHVKDGKVVSEQFFYTPQPQFV